MSGKGRPGPECGIDRALSKMAPNDRETAEMILEDQEGYEGPLLAESLTDLLRRSDPEHPRISTAVVKHHRQRECRCADD